MLAWALWAATTIGLVLTLRRPANPIGWLYAASALTWSLIIPLDPWLDQLVRDQRPLSLLAQLVAVAELTIWAPAIALGVTLPALLVPDGRLRSPAGGWSPRPRSPARPCSWGVFLIPGADLGHAGPVRQPLGPAGPPVPPCGCAPTGAEPPPGASLAGGRRREG